MISKTSSLEAWLNNLFAKSSPRLPSQTKKTLVEWAPTIGLVLGALSLLAAWSLWHWANTVIYYAGTMCAIYPGYICPLPVSRFSVWLWLGVIFLAIEGLLYLFAYPKLNSRKKEGWDYLYYGTIINTAYAIVSLFASYDSLNHFIGGLIGSVAGLYLLFQIRDSYLGPKRIAPTKTSSKK
jgi:hypothetical protein